jgi:NPCBM/NEW2 domain
MRLLLYFPLALALGQPAVEKADGPRFQVVTVAGPISDATLTGLEKFRLDVKSDRPRSLGPDDWIALRREGLPLPAMPAAPFVVLSGGDRVPIVRPESAQLDDERLRFSPAPPIAPGTGAEMTIPQAGLAAICFTLPTGVDDFDRILPATKGDVVVLRNGDRLQGSLRRLAAGAVTLSQSERTTTIPYDRLAAILFDPELQARTRPRTLFAQAVLTGGARLRFKALSLEGDQLIGTLPVGGAVRVPLDRVVDLQIRNGAAVYLDELKPAAVEETPFLDTTWPSPSVRGRTLLGDPLRLGIDTYDTGFAAHSRTRMRYALDSQYRTFEAIVGVDPKAGPRAAVRIGVEVDGKSAASQLCKAGDAPVPLRVDVSGAKTLTLVTDFGPLGDVQGHAIWAEPRLVRAK